MTARELPRLIFLGGLGRSGSTLLERLLGELPGVCSVGEIAHIWQRCLVDDDRCGCGEPFHSCLFWTEVGRLAFGGWDKVDVRRVAGLHKVVDRSRFIPVLAAPVLTSSFQRKLNEYLEYYLALYAAVAQASGCSTVVDSSKHASLAFSLRWSDELDLRVLHLVRDSRAVAFSWTQSVNRPETPNCYMTVYSPVKSAGLWNLQNAALHLLAARGVPTLRVRYEDLVVEPDSILSEIEEFAGIRSLTTGRSFLRKDGEMTLARLGLTHSASGNPMRFTTGDITIRADERWRTAMPVGQRRTVTALTLPLLARYGYARPAT